MADFATAYLDRLEANTAFSGIAGDRVFWVKAPAGVTPPYVRLQTVSDVRPQTLKGAQKFRPTRLQADCFAKSYGQARALAEALIAASIDPMTVGTIQFGRAKAEGPRDLGEDTDNGFMHRASVDVMLWHMEI